MDPVKRLARAGVFAALICLTTAYVLHIPVAGGGYIHPGDALVYLAACLLPMPYGLVAAGLGSAVADLLTAPIWAPWTLIIKGLCVPAFSRKSRKLLCSRNLLACGLGAAVNLAGYYAANWVLLPANARKRNDVVTAQQAELEQAAAGSPYNIYKEGTDKKLGILASGIGYNYVNECFPEGCPYPVLKISQYPLPRQLVRRLLDECQEMLIVEEGQPFIEDQVRGVSDLKNVHGKLDGTLPRTGELNPDIVKKALGMESGQCFDPCADVAPRPPALCQGCGHRDVYAALNEVLKEYDNPRVFGDIGCYTLGFLPPFRAIHSCVDMGASITMAKGAADAGQWPAVAIIGDSTFTHSGMTGLLDAINENADITVIISDNLTTGMTGGQDSAGTNKFEAICRGLGLSDEHLKVVVPLPKNMPGITQAIRDEINYHGTSVIIPRRECMQTLQRHLKQKKVQK